MIIDRFCQIVWSKRGELLQVQVKYVCNRSMISRGKEVSNASILSDKFLSSNVPKTIEGHLSNVQFFKGLRSAHWVAIISQGEWKKNESVSQETVVDMFLTSRCGKLTVCESL